MTYYEFVDAGTWAYVQYNLRRTVFRLQPYGFGHRGADYIAVNYVFDQYMIFLRIVYGSISM